MAGAYVDKLNSLIARTISTDPSSPAGKERPKLEVKHFFSSAAAYVNSRIFMTLTPIGLALKLPETARQALLAAGGKPLRYFPNAPIKKDYVIAPDDLTDEDLASLVEASMEYVVAV